MTRRWILLRGLTREAAHWGSFPAELAARLGAGHAVEVLDLPGSGTRHREHCPMDVAAITQDCRARVRPGEPVVLLAMSLGAMVAMEWCRLAPGEVAGCALINTSAGGHSPPWARLRPAGAVRLLRLLALPSSALMREREVLAMTSADPARHPRVASTWADIATQRPVTRPNALRQLIAAARWRAPVAAPAVPVLLLASRGDRLVSPACSIRLAQAWQQPLELHPWAGHDLPLDDPAWVLEALARWRPVPA